MPLSAMQVTKKTPGGAENSSVEALKRSVGNLSKLPMLPEAAIKAMAVANDPNSSLTKLAGVIETDLALATGILRLANSPLYRIGRTIESLGPAVVRLGLRETQSLIVTVGMRSLFRSVTMAKRQQCETLWRHFFTTACMARRLNRALGLGFQGEEFSSALSHDIGRLLIAIGAPAAFDRADPVDFLESPEVLVREQSVLGTDHCALGSWFTSLNQLPPSLIAAVQFHHTVAEAAEHQKLVGLVAMADDMANHWQRLQSAEGYDPVNNQGWLQLAHDWNEEKRTRLTGALSTVMTDVAEETKNVISVT